MNNAKKTKLLRGIVLSNKMQKTIVVECVKLVRHKLYNKVLKKITKFKAHDEKNIAGIGDEVEIALTRPLSKEKCFRLTRIIKKCQSVEAA